MNIQGLDEYERKSMAKLHAELIALADYAMNAEDKKLSVIGIFDKVFVKALPSHHPRMSFVVTVAGEPRLREEMKMKVLSPSKKEAFTADVNVVLGENGKANLISNFEGFPFAESGTYTFLLEKSGKEVASYNLDVIQVKEDEGTRVAN